MLKKPGLFFKSPVATVSLTRKLGSFIMSMPANATWHVRHCAVYRAHSLLPFLSVLIANECLTTLSLTVFTQRNLSCSYRSSVFLLV